MLIQSYLDWCSRIAYVVVAVLGLAAALKLPGRAAFSGWLLITVTALSYAANVYFSVVSTTVVQKRIVKKLQKRIDFSIDIFSPSLDLEKHIARRIQQESLSTLLLAAPEYRIPPRHPLVFHTIAVGDKKCPIPPYLLDFKGTQGERHIENLKILRELGLPRYINACERLKQLVRYTKLEGESLWDLILDNCTGPDCYWEPSRSKSDHSASALSHFGRATVIPFPFCVVFNYDHARGDSLISEIPELQEYYCQNISADVLVAKRNRIALRALDGKRCHWPVQELKRYSRWTGPSRRHPDAGILVSCNVGVLHIQRNCERTWEGYK